MPDSTSDPLAEQVERAVRRQQAEGERLRAASTQEGRVYEERARWHQQLAARAAGLTSGLASAAQTTALYGAAGVAALGAHFGRNAGFGVSYATLQTRAGSSQLLDAMGMGAGLGAGPLAQGQIGSYQGGAQSFGGLVYRAGGGALLNTLTGGLGFADYGTVAGMPPGLVQQRAEDELRMRFSRIGQSFVSGIPFSWRFGQAFRGLRGDFARDFAQNLGFMPNGGAAGGIGIRSTGAAASMFAEQSQGYFEEVNNRLRGGMSEEDVDARSRAADSLRTTGDYTRMFRSSTDPRKMRQLIRQTGQTVDAVIDSLKISAEEAADLLGRLGKQFDSTQVGTFAATVDRAARSGGLGRMSRSQAFEMVAQFGREGAVMGLTGSGVSGYAGRQLGRFQTMNAEASRGVYDRNQLMSYGATQEEAVRNLQGRFQQVGLVSGLSDPGMAALYQTGSAGVSSLLRGGGYFDVLGSAARSMAANPYAALSARYDPATKERMMSTGMAAAVQRALRQSEMTPMPGGSSADRRRLAIESFRQSAGIQSEDEARQLFEMHASSRTEALRTAADGGLKGADGQRFYEYYLQNQAQGISSISGLLNEFKELSADGQDPLTSGGSRLAEARRNRLFGSSGEAVSYLNLFGMMGGPGGTATGSAVTNVDRNAGAHNQPGGRTLSAYNRKLERWMGEAPSGARLSEFFSAAGGLTDRAGLNSLIDSDSMLRGQARVGANGRLEVRGPNGWQDVEAGEVDGDVARRLGSAAARLYDRSAWSTASAASALEQSPGYATVRGRLEANSAVGLVDVILRSSAGGLSTDQRDIRQLMQDPVRGYGHLSDSGQTDFLRAYYQRANPMAGGRELEAMVQQAKTDKDVRARVLQPADSDTAGFVRQQMGLGLLSWKVSAAAAAPRPDGSATRPLYVIEVK